MKIITVIVSNVSRMVLKTGFPPKKIYFKKNKTIEFLLNVGAILPGSDFLKPCDITAPETEEKVHSHLILRGGQGSPLWVRARRARVTLLLVWTLSLVAIHMEP